MKNILLIPIVLLIPFFFSLNIKPKDFDIEVEERYGGARYDALHDIQEVWTGGFVAVGESKSWSEGKEDFYIVTMNENGQKVMEKRLGRGLTDIARGVAVTNDGGYIVVGSSTSVAGNESSKGGIDAIALKLNYDLSDIWFESELFSSSDNEYFTSIEPIDSNRFVIVGQQSDKLYAVCVDLQGALRWKYRLEEFKFSEGLSVTSSDSKIFITGTAGESNDTEESELLVVSLDPDGKMLWSKKYRTEHHLTIGRKIIKLKNDNLAIAGECYSKKFAVDGALLVTSSDGDLISVRPYGDDNGDDAFYGIIEDHFGDLVLLGHGRGRGDKRENGWIIKVDSNGERIWKNDEANFLGRDKRDHLYAGSLSSTGSIVMAGSTTRFPRSGEAWFLKLNAELPQISTPQSDDIGFLDYKLLDEDGNDIITNGERGYLEVTIENRSSSRYFNIFASVTTIEENPLIKYFPKISIGSLEPDSIHTIVVPVIGFDSLDTDTLELFMQLQERDLGTSGSYRSITDPYSILLKTDDKAESLLELEDVEFEPLSDKGFQRGARMRLAVNIVNTGNSTSSGSYFQYTLPPNVAHHSPLWQPLGDMTPGESIRMYIEFEPSYLFFEDSLSLGIRIINPSMQLITEDTFYLRVEEEEILPQPIERELFCQWVGFSDSTDIVVKDSVFGCRLNVYSNSALEGDDFTLTINQQEVRPTKQSIDLYTHDTEFEDVYDYQYRFVVTFALDSGQNTVQVNASSEAGAYALSPINITYDPIEPKLHIFSVGVPLRDIKEYAANDALSFDSLFASIGQSYFQDVRSILLNDRQDTRERSISSNIYNLKKDYLQQIINPEDILLVFISSHSTIATPGSFKIKASNFDGFFPDITSIDYVGVIERFLRQINCQKLVFLDVFNERSEENDDSESKEEDPPLLSEKFVEILNQKPNSTPVILACGPGEASFENSSNQHGVFASSILSAMRHENLPILDGNRNNIITIREFFQQLKQNVIQFAGNDQPQTPYFDDRNMIEDFGITLVTRSF